MASSFSSSNGSASRTMRTAKGFILPETFHTMWPLKAVTCGRILSCLRWIQTPERRGSKPGAPPDEFVPKGQGWGNPTYAWPVHQEDGFKWWRRRIAENGALYDAIRLDHFRGFESFWAIPAGSNGSEDGYFVRGPGKAFFEAMRESAGSAEMFVEDLGFITDEVHALRESLGLPGMSVLQLAFNGQKDHPYLPYKCLPTP